MEIETAYTNLHRILVPSPTLPPATTTNAWITAQTGGMVIDPAATHVGHSTVDRAPHRISAPVFLTHHHHDHIGAAEIVRDHFSIPIIAHKQTDELVTFQVDQHVDDRQEFSSGGDTWTAIHTPGHAPGSFVSPIQKRTGA